ncbi:hypothetical protein HUJ04_013544 [Dendroctonus ponderosae]|nr:hypothetical protein HUJ04_013544 [Dendroctonus ponderosae]
MSVKFKDRYNLSCSDLKFMTKVANNPDFPHAAEDVAALRKRKACRQRSFKYGLVHSDLQLPKCKQKLKHSTLEPGCNVDLSAKKESFGGCARWWRKLKICLHRRCEKASRFLLPIYQIFLIKAPPGV